MQQGDLVLQRLSRARYLADQSLAEARRSVWALRSKSLEEKKLADALRDSVPGLTAGRELALSVEAPAGLPRFPTELETDLLRVAQEAVMNVVKHARARHLALRLRYEAGKVELHIEDDGRGFSVDDAQVGRDDSSGFGLTAMRERMVRHGGALKIESRPQRGTHVVACVQFPHDGA
jgi:signal transduction histidine kinase